MCRLEERVYISPEGHRSKLEDISPCDKSRNGKLCSKVKKRTIEYYPKRTGILPRGDAPPPANPPTPTGAGTFLLQRTSSSSSGRPVIHDGQKAIIIEFSTKSHKSKKYNSGPNEHVSINATDDDVAVESPGSDDSHTIRTGFPEAPLPEAIFGPSDAYRTTSILSHEYHHRQISSPPTYTGQSQTTSSYPGSSRTPSLYFTSDPDYDSPSNKKSTTLPPAIHSPSNVGAPSPPGQSRTRNYGLTLVTPKYTQKPPLPDTLPALDYQDFADRSGPSHASFGSASKIGRGQASGQLRKKKDEESKRQDLETENIKQVRFELGSAESRAQHRSETLLAEKEKQRAADREAIRQRKENEREQREYERESPSYYHSRTSDTSGDTALIRGDPQPQPKIMEPIPKDKMALVFLPTVKTTQASPARLAVGSKVRIDFVSPNDSTTDSTETDWGPTSSAESADNSHETSEDCEVHVNDALSSAMSVVKHLLLRELLDHTLLGATDAFGESNRLASGSTGSSTSRSFASSSVGSQTPSKGKRLRGGSRDPNDGDGDGDHSDDGDDGRPKKKGGSDFPDRFPQRRLKCPFYQRHPDKYTKAACRGSGFVDMAKLKDHIKRVHTQPLRCSRCWLEMESDDAYSTHLQQESICGKATEPLEDRIRPQLLKRLEFKKAPYSNAKNVEEKWKMLYKVLFPSDETVPSPYEQQGMSPQLERALYEALEEELTRELALVIEPILTKIKGCIPAIIEKCRDKLRNSSPLSDDGLAFTPPSTRSVAGSGNGAHVRTTEQDSVESDSGIFPFTGILSGTSVNTNMLAEGGGDIMTQSPVPSAGCFDAIDPRGIFVERDCTNRNIQAVNQHDPRHRSHKGATGAILGPEQGSMNQASFAGKPEFYNRNTTGNSAPVSSNEGGMLDLFHLGRNSAQHDFPYFPSREQSSWPGEEADWQAEVAEDLFQQTEDSQFWESFMRDFDMNGGRF